VAGWLGGDAHRLAAMAGDHRAAQLAIAFLYWAAPNIDIPFKFITPGAIAFVIVWIITSLLFGFYVSNFGSYNAIYGVLGGVVVLLIWIYISSLLLLVGAEVNAMVSEEAEPEEMQQRRAQKFTQAQPA
jgi:YihY family inner membrane protein